MIYVVSIALLFAVMVVLQRRWPQIRCALCIAVCLTWIGGLALVWSGFSVSPILLGILMGQTSLGILHTLETRVQKKYKVFRLPFLLTMIWGVYSILEGPEWSTLLLIGTLWIVFSVTLHLPALRKATRVLIQCCRDW